MIALLPLLLVACDFGHEEPAQKQTRDPSCRRHLISVERAGSTAEDPGVWELDIFTARGTLACRASRGGWVCPSQRAAGRPGTGATNVPRGLPPRTTVSVLPEDGDDASKFEFEVRRNGVVRFRGPATCGGAPPRPCTPAGDYLVVGVPALP